MRKLYHQLLSPDSRLIRLALGEKRLHVELVEEDIDARRTEFLTLNPAGDVPVLADDDDTIVCGGMPICEYLDEKYVGIQLIGDTVRLRVEVRRLAHWFLDKFAREVSVPLLQEKVIKRLKRQGQPNTQRIRAASNNMHYHLDYISFLLEKRRWLAGREISIADLAAAGHLSCLDYVGDVPWEQHKDAKDWYVRIKSRPSFRDVLQDRISGLPPSTDYGNLDF